MKMSAPDFWDDNERAQKLIAEANAVKEVVEALDALTAESEELKTLMELLEEEYDEQLAGDLAAGVQSLTSKLEQF